MRALIAALAIAASIVPGHLLSASDSEVFPPVDNGLLVRCQTQITAKCLADISWALSQEEKRGFNLGQLAPIFAQLGQWDRADSFLAKMPSNDIVSKVSKDGQVKYVEAERLAAALSAGKVGALRPIQDPFILSWAASRLLGYLPRENVVASDRIGKRLNEGLWKRLLPADRPIKLALLKHWERVLDQSPTYLKVSLADKFLLLGEATQARRVAKRIKPKPDDVGRDLIELLLRLGEPTRALDAIEVSSPRSRGLYRTLVAKYLDTQGKSEEASKVALDAADDSFGVNDFDRVLTTVELLAEMNRVDLAKKITAKADQLSETQGRFRSFDISAVGEMYGWAQDLQACLRLQAKAGAIGYSGGGMFDLGPELKENVATRSLRCGDKAALKAVNNRWLARGYCDFYRRGLVSTEYILQRPQKLTDDDAPRSLLFERAAECHFERGESAVALSLLHRLLDEARLSADFHAARSAAELACVFDSRKLCGEVLEMAGQVLIKAVAARKLSAQHVVEFAAVWQNRSRGQ